jgi:hypothetical protein
VHVVTEIARTRKGTGYMVHTDAFSCFLFEDSQLLASVLEALRVYVEQMHGYQFFVQVEEKDPYFRIAVDFQAFATWQMIGGKFVWSANGTDTSTQAATNPFLPPTTQKANSGRHKQKESN